MNNLSHYDDVSAINMGMYWLGVKIDGFSAFNSKFPWASWSDWGWKAVTACISDLVVKGFEPLIAMYSLGIERPEIAEEIAKGVYEALQEYKVYFGGGDFNKAHSDAWIDVACIGISCTNPIPRHGAEVGNVIIVTGYYGLQGAALHSYYKLRKEPCSSEIIKITRRPKARIEAIPILHRYRNCITASIDISDGLVESLYQLAEERKLVIELDYVPIHTEAKAYAKIHGLDPLDLALYGGEEFEILIAVREECSNTIIHELRKLNIPAHRIGKIISQGDAKILFQERIIVRKGWNHFVPYYEIN